ncbi:MAG: hypothetical protein AB7L94_26700 [Kofleriaceae bacterium]
MKAAIVLASVLSLAAREARAADCAADADRLRAHLEVAEVNTSRWQLAWTIVFTSAAAGQFALALAEWNPFGEFDDKYRDTLLVGGTKATIGIGSRLIFPLRAHVPAPNADRCVELAELRKSITKLGKKERQSFWLTHLGGTALNLAGVAVLWYLHDFKTGALSFAISYPVGITSAYTLPRASWHLWREEKSSWTVGVLPSDERTMFVVGGEW